jgi:RNA polymerase sigma factor (sigma-70 family)
VIDEGREQALARRVIEARTLEARALHWEKRYRGFVKADQLCDDGNFALESIVREYKVELGGFDDYARRRIDYAMLTGIRIEARRKRIDWAAQRAAADLLATWRADSGDAPPDQIREMLHAVAAATFVVQAEEAQRGGIDDMIAREDYATAMEVIASVLAAQPKPRRRLFVMNYQDGKHLSEIAGLLGIHQKTAEGWRKTVLAEMHAALVKRGILHPPSRGGAPRLYVLDALREPKDEAKDEQSAANDDGDGEEYPDR